MPQLFKSMAKDRFPGHNIKIKFIGRGGATLKQHWEDRRASDEIRSGKWDYVVLQEQSMLGEEIIENGKSYVQNPDSFFEYAAKFAQEIEKSGAESVFYMTWSRKKYPQQQKYLTYAYMHIAEETASKIAPVGMIWDELRSQTKFNLYENDGSHPSVYGSYTAALTLFSVIFDRDPVDIPGRLEGFEIQRGGKIAEEKSTLCDLAEADTKMIQNAVSDIFHQLKKSNDYLEVEKAVSDKRPSRFTKILNYIHDSRNQFTILVIIIGLILAVKGGLFLIKK